MGTIVNSAVQDTHKGEVVVLVKQASLTASNFRLCITLIATGFTFTQEEIEAMVSPYPNLTLKCASVFGGLWCVLCVPCHDVYVFMVRSINLCYVWVISHCELERYVRTRKRLRASRVSFRLARSMASSRSACKQRCSLLVSWSTSALRCNSTRLAASSMSQKR